MQPPNPNQPPFGPGGQPPFRPASWGNQRPIPPTGYQPYATQPAAQGTSGLAIASLVCSLVGLFLCGLPAVLGVIFGGVALGQTKDNARPGRGLAMAGLIVGILVVLLWGALWIAAATNDNGCFYFGTRPARC